MQEVIPVKSDKWSLRGKPTGSGTAVHFLSPHESRRMLSGYLTDTRSPQGQNALTRVNERLNDFN